MEDLEIVKLFLDRKDSAISETENKYGRYCYKISFNILNNHQDSEECVNDTMIKTWNSIPPKRPVSLSAYLGKIIRNISLNLYKSKRAMKRGGGQVDTIIHELEECIPHWDGVEDKFLERENSRDISNAVNKFLQTQKKENRVLLVRRYFYGDKISDIALRYGIPESRIKSLLFRCRKKLKVFLIKEGIEI